MTRKVFSCVLIGLGDIGLIYDLNLDQHKYIKTHARAFSLNSGFDLQGAVDINTEACNVFNKEYGIKSYIEIEDALLEIKPELIILAVPTSFQLEAIKKIAKCYKPKAILCEKPMGDNLQQSKEIVNICRKIGVSLYVNYIRRCLPGSIEVRDRIQKSLIKSPMKCVVWYSKGLMHNGSHFINLMEYWFGKCLDTKIITQGREFKDFGVEPYVYLTFENCEVSLMPAWEELYSHYTIEVISATGRLYWGQSQLHWSEVNNNETLQKHKYLVEEPEDLFIGDNKYQMHVTNQLYCAMQNKMNSICTGEDALETTNTIDRILKIY